MKKKILLLALMFIGSSISIIAQPKTLTEEEYIEPIRKAEDLEFNTSRRVKTETTLYNENKVITVKKVIDEFLLPNAQRRLTIKTENEKTESQELIRIDRDVFQKLNNGKWIKDENLRLGIPTIGIPAPISQEYSVEDAKIKNKSFKIYYSLDVYNPFSGDATQYLQKKLWIDENGFNVKSEIIIGYYESKTIKSRSISEFEYSPKDLVIKAPKIKSTTKKK